MSEIVTEGQNHIPAQAVTIFPNRLNLDSLRALESALGGALHVAWLVDYHAMPATDIMNHLKVSRADGLLINLERMSREMVSEQIHDKLKAGRHVVLLPARPAQQAASLTDVMPPLLHCLDGSTLNVLPVYVGMYTRDISRAIVTEGPCDITRLEFLPLQRAGEAMGARIRGAWMEAAANQFQRHQLLRELSLTDALVHALAGRPTGRIIDGMNDSDLDYHTLLSLALLVGNHLKTRTICRKIGIILPPGKMSIIANLACLFAGVIPVNFNYNTTAETFRAQANRLSINRYITERRFTLKQQSFAWPRKLDHLYLEDIIKETGSFRLGLVRRLLKWGKLSFAAKHCSLATPKTDDTAAVFFTKSLGPATKGVAMSHSMLLASALQVQSRLQLKPGERVLAVTPYYEPHGYLFGFLLPLLCGQDIVTYPAADTPQRLCALCKNYSPVLTTFTAGQCYELLASAKADTFSAMRYFFITGSRMPALLYNKALKEFKLPLYNAYTVAESAAPISLCMPLPEHAENAPVQAAGTPGTAGCPLVGTAVVTVDTDVESQVLPLSATGCLWVKSPCLPAGYISDGKPGTPPATPPDLQEGRLRTGDVGGMNADGMLLVLGRRARFSKIGGIVTSHEQVEEVILNVLKPAAGGPRKIAVVGIPGTNGDRLILLSTLHATAGPQDVITLRYAITNAHHPAHWAPEKIISVPSIPTLANGQLNFPACLAIVKKALGLK